MFPCWAVAAISIIRRYRRAIFASKSCYPPAARAGLRGSQRDRTTHCAFGFAAIASLTVHVARYQLATGTVRASRSCHINPRWRASMPEELTAQRETTHAEQDSNFGRRNKRSDRE